jgi:hypothetical protein
VTYRPITDVWILARSKVKYYGAYPAGFLHRARAVLGVTPADRVLHVCAGRVRDYPYAGVGPHDKTLDLDPATCPDFLRDATRPLPFGPWDAVLIDRPYTPEDAAHYTPGAEKLPEANLLLKHALRAVEVGHKVGMLDYVWPHPGKLGKEVAVIAVGTGRNNRARWFTVFERIL